MRAGITVAYKLLRTGVEVLLPIADALAERRGHRHVEDLDGASGAYVCFNAVESRRRALAARADSPDLAGRQRITVNPLIAVELRR